MDANLRRVTVAHGGKATVTEVELYLRNDDKKFEMIRARGEAFRHPDDKDDEELAVMLATGRALQNLGRKLERRANGLVKHHDDMKVYRVKQAQSEPAESPRRKVRRFLRRATA